MIYGKEQQQTQIGQPRISNDGTTILNMNKDTQQKIHHGISNLGQIKEHIDIDGINFVICRSCFWCASIFIFKHPPAENCPNCSLAMLESIPIASNERFEISQNQKRGMTIEFSLRSK